MRVHRSATLRAGGTCAVLFALVAVLAAAEPGADLTDLPAGLPAGLPADLAAVAPPPIGAGPLLVRHVGTEPVTLDTTRLAGPALRAWWIDGVGDRTVDGGTVQRGTAVTLFPPDTGDGGAHDWTLIVVDATRGLVPPA
jgi:hypothetical protein